MNRLMMLSSKKRAGTLTPEEQAEYDSLVSNIVKEPQDVRAASIIPLDGGEGLIKSLGSMLGVQGTGEEGALTGKDVAERAMRLAALDRLLSEDSLQSAAKAIGMGVEAVSDPANLFTAGLASVPKMMAKSAAKGAAKGALREIPDLKKGPELERVRDDRGWGAIDNREYIKKLDTTGKSTSAAQPKQMYSSYSKEMLSDARKTREALAERARVASGEEKLKFERMLEEMDKVSPMGDLRMREANPDLVDNLNTILPLKGFNRYK